MCCCPAAPYHLVFEAEQGDRATVNQLYTMSELRERPSFADRLAYAQLHIGLSHAILSTRKGPPALYAPGLTVENRTEADPDPAGTVLVTSSNCHVHELLWAVERLCVRAWDDALPCLREAVIRLFGHFGYSFAEVGRTCLPPADPFPTNRAAIAAAAAVEQLCTAGSIALVVLTRIMPLVTIPDLGDHAPPLLSYAEATLALAQAIECVEGVGSAIGPLEHRRTAKVKLSELTRACHESACRLHREHEELKGRLPSLAPATNAVSCAHGVLSVATLSASGFKREALWAFDERCGTGNPGAPGLSHPRLRAQLNTDVHTNPAHEHMRPDPQAPHLPEQYTALCCEPQKPKGDTYDPLKRMKPHDPGTKDDPFCIQFKLALIHG